MVTAHRRRDKLMEWVRRYLPCEIASTVAELGGAALVYLWTGSFALAAVVATVCASVGYYGAAYINAVRWSYRDQRHRARLPRAVVANLLALRSIALEFGPAEAVDSLAVRPAAFYLGPVLIGNAAVGFIVGKIVADIGFYVCAIFSYEKFQRLLAIKRDDSKETDDEAGVALPTG